MLSAHSTTAGPRPNARSPARNAAHACITVRPARPAAAGGAAAAAQAQRVQQQRRSSGFPFCRSGYSRVETVDAPPALKAQEACGELPALPPLDGQYESTMAFASYANWLIPGRLMVGRYPYVEPSRCASHQLGEEQLGDIIGAGPRVFVSLQAEVPPQADMRPGGVGGFLPYKAAAELIAAACTPPPPMEVVNGLRNPQLDKFLPQRKRKAAPEVEAYYGGERVEFLHRPIVDLGVPSMDELVAAVEDLGGRLARGQKLYVHCWGGRGRAGTIGACLLASLYGLSADEALERVQRAFDTRRDNQRRSPETDEQHALVREFAASHARRQQ